MKKKKLNKNDTSSKKRSVGKKVAKQASRKRNVNEGTYNGVPYESGCELAFLYFAEVLKQKGFISKIERSESFLLCDSITHNYSLTGKRGASRPMTQTISLGHSYTADYRVTFTKKALGKFCWLLGDNSKNEKNLFVCQQIDNQYVTYVEVKPDFDSRGKTRSAINDMKWVFQKHEIFINLFRPNRWFEGTFTPSNYQFTERGVKRKLNFEVRTIDEYLKSILNDKI